MSTQPATKTVYHFPLFGLMFLIFLTLKLIGTITWSWWWVTAPLWAPAAIALSIFAFAAVITFTVVLFVHIFEKKKSF